MKALPHAVVVGLVAGTIVLAGASVAVSIHYAPALRSFQFSGLVIVDGPIPCQADITPMAGTEVTLHWWATNSTLLLVDYCGDWGQPGPGGAGELPTYMDNGTNGFGSFVAEGGGYMFGVPCAAFCDPPATVAGNYTASVLVL